MTRPETQYAEAYKRRMKEAGPIANPVELIAEQLYFHLTNAHGMFVAIEPVPGIDDGRTLVINIDQGVDLPTLEALLEGVEHAPHSYDTKQLKIHLVTLAHAFYVQGLVNYLY